MQDAKREINFNDDQDLNEFDENNPEGMTEEEMALQRRAREETMLEQQRQRELQSKQKINDGISLTQGEIKKHEEIDWDTSDKLNLITKAVLNYTKQQFSFEDYMDERAKKDPKFVPLQQEEEALNNSQDNKDDAKDKDSEFSFSEDEENSTKGNSAVGGKQQFEWDRFAAEQSFINTRREIDVRLV